MLHIEFEPSEQFGQFPYEDKELVDFAESLYKESLKDARDSAFRTIVQTIQQMVLSSQVDMPSNRGKRRSISDNWYRRLNSLARRSDRDRACAALVVLFFRYLAETERGTAGVLDAYIRVLSNSKCLLDSTMVSSSNTVDIGLWDQDNQAGACYECKVSDSIKTNQLEWLQSIFNACQGCMDVVLATFAKEYALQVKMEALGIKTSCIPDVRVVDLGNYRSHFPKLYLA